MRNCMTRNRISADWLRLALLLALPFLGTACHNGGNCQYTEMTEFAQVTKIESFVILQSAIEGAIELPQEDFTPPAKKGQYYQLGVKRQTSGSCNPLSVFSVEQLYKEGFALSPTSEQAYQASFILDIARNCAHRPSGACDSDQKLRPGFNSQAEILENIDPRSVKACTPRAMQYVWPHLQPANDTQRLIACVEDSDENEVVIEFLQIKTGKKHEQLLLNRIY